MSEESEKANKSKGLVVLCNIPPSLANDVAEKLVTEGLVACVNVIPRVVSVYKWEGCVQKEEESTMLMKTMPEKYASLESRLTELHPYEVPEIIALSVSEINAPYLSWMQEVIDAKEVKDSQ